MYPEPTLWNKTLPGVKVSFHLIMQHPFLFPTKLLYSKTKLFDPC